MMMRASQLREAKRPVPAAVPTPRHAGCAISGTWERLAFSRASSSRFVPLVRSAVPYYAPDYLPPSGSAYSVKPRAEHGV